MPEDHPHHVALWFAEVFGGPRPYTEEHGGYPHMLRKHLGLALTETQRARWGQLIGLAADDVGLPADPEFRSAFLAYVEWGTRIALATRRPARSRRRRLPCPAGAGGGRRRAAGGGGRGPAVPGLSRPARGTRRRMPRTTRRDLVKLGAAATLAAGATAAPAAARPRRHHHHGRDLPIGYPLGPFTRDK